MEHFRIPKTILEHDIFKRPLEFRLLQIIIGNACYGKAYKLGGVEIVRGQWLRSVRKLQDDLERYDKQNKLVKPRSLSVRNAIKYLAENNLINFSNTQLGTLFTVINFDIYQGHLVYSQGIHQEEFTNRVYSQGTHQDPECIPRGNGECIPRGNNIEKGINKINIIEKEIRNIRDIEKERKKKAIEELMTRDVNSSIKNKDKFIRGIFNEKDLRTDWSQFH